MVTTLPIIARVAASSNGYVPDEVAWAMREPTPVTYRGCPAKSEYSATMLAFQAPPLAVTAPVIRYGKRAGRIRIRQRFHGLSCSSPAVYRKSWGMALAPAMTLN